MDKRATRPTPQDAVNDLEDLGRMKGQDVWDIILPRGRTATQPCTRCAAVALVSIERLFSAVRLPFTDLRSWPKQDAV